MGYAIRCKAKGEFYMKPKINQEIRKFAEQIINSGKGGRVKTALEILIKNGSVTTEELKELGYDHPPRAIRDIKDFGIPIISTRTKSTNSNRSIAKYTFGTKTDNISSNFSGRTTIPKKFKRNLIEHYGSIDCITGSEFNSSDLQVDHRVPYKIGGDKGLKEGDVTKFMLLFPSIQRTKSWSCENCPNMNKQKDPKVCNSCYWAFPENYTHIATEEIRMVELVWKNEEIVDYEKLLYKAKQKNISVTTLIKEILSKRK